MVADLQLDVEAQAREVARERAEPADPRLAVGHEQAVEAHREEAPALQPPQGGVALGGVLGDGGDVWPVPLSPARRGPIPNRTRGPPRGASSA